LRSASVVRRFHNYFKQHLLNRLMDFVKIKSQFNLTGITVWCIQKNMVLCPGKTTCIVTFHIIKFSRLRFHGIFFPMNVEFLFFLKMYYAPIWYLEILIFSTHSFSKCKINMLKYTQIIYILSFLRLLYFTIRLQRTVLLYISSSNILYGLLR
jgi:hypothetical protein